jgi:beta-mannan synthase
MFLLHQVSIPLWALVHLPVVVTLSTAAFTPNGWVHSILYVLFENAMGIVKLGAVIAGMIPRSSPAHSV